MKIRPILLSATLLCPPLLNGCATESVRYPRSAAANPPVMCRWMPMTRYMWGEGYQALLKAKIEPNWLYPAYVGLGTAVWATATPFLPVADAFTAPAWLGESCS